MAFEWLRNPKLDIKEGERNQKRTDFQTRNRQNDLGLWLILILNIKI